MKNDMKQLLNDAFYATEPKEKQNFLKNIRPREVSVLEMLLQQFSYIRVTVWLYALLLIVIAVLGSVYRVEQTTLVITMMMPFAAVASVLETRRSKKYGMSELEMATRFSLRSVVIARLLIVGLAAITVLCVVSPMIATTFGEDVNVTAIHIVIPYCITMIIGLQLERSPLGRATEYGSIMVAFVISFLALVFYFYHPVFMSGYTEIIEKWGVFVALLLMVITAMEQWKTVNNVEEFA